MQDPKEPEDRQNSPEQESSLSPEERKQLEEKFRRLMSDPEVRQLSGDLDPESMTDDGLRMFSELADHLWGLGMPEKSSSESSQVPGETLAQEPPTED